MEKYKVLLECIHRFKELRFWDYIDGSDIFEVKTSSQNVYVSILGQAHIEYGMVVYEDLRDFSSQLMCENDNQEVEQPDTPFRLSCLKIDCLDGQLISQYDSSGMIFEYGIEDNCIAIKYSIGKPMRLVNQKECSLLIEVLRILIDNEEKIKALDFDNIKGSETYSLEMVQGKLISKVISFPALKPIEYTFSQKIDQELFDKVYEFEKKDEWAAGIFYSPVYIDVDSPYFPKICVIYNRSQEKLLEVIVPYYDEYEYYPQFFLEALNKIGYLPEYLFLANYETVSCFAMLLDALNINGEVAMVEELNEVYDYLGQELVKDIKENDFIS